MRYEVLHQLHKVRPHRAAEREDAEVDGGDGKTRVRS